MDILYMGYFCNEDLFNELVEKGSKSSHARQQFERKLLCGLLENSEGHNLRLRSYLPLVDDGFLERKGERYQGCNVEYLWCKKSIAGIWRSLISNINCIKRWNNGSDGKKIILMYSANPLHCIPAMLLRKKYGYKIVTISSEISIYRREAGNRLLFWIQKKISYFLENNFDAYVLLSKYMNEVVNVRKKPYIIMEGFSEPSCGQIEFEPSKSDRIVLFYAGWLSEDNGIKILVEGFKQRTCGNMELQICGMGDLEDYVKKSAEADSGIKYLGVLPNDEVQKLERQASFLINPRFSYEEYTKYSFPSKTLEYMSTGIPTILTRLKGIPEEYFDYAIVLDDESVKGIRNLLEEIGRIPYEEYSLLGRRALQFVFEKKSPYVQGKRILNFICKL